MAGRCVVVAGNRTTLSKEMCHEEIHRRPRADLADRDPVAHRDCKRSPRVAVEPGVREQRLLTMSGRAFPLAVQDLAFAWRPARTGWPAARTPYDQSCRCGGFGRRDAGCRLIHGAVGCANERKRDQSKARQMKSRHVGGFANHGGLGRDPTTLLGSPAPQMPAFENRIPAPLAAPSQPPVINGPSARSPYGGVM